MNSKPTIILVAVSALAVALSASLATALFYVVDQKRLTVASFADELALGEKSEISGIAMKRLFNDTKEEREKLDSYFVGAGDVVSFIESIENISSVTRTKISVNNVSVEQTPASKQFEYLVLNASALGSFNNLHWLLSLIEEMPLKIDVVKVVFEEMQSGEGEKGKEKEWRMDFTVKALKFK